MTIEFNFKVIIISSLIILGFFSAVVLWFRTHNKLSNKLLAAFLVCTSLWLIDSFFSVAGIYTQNANFYFKPIYYSFAFGPLIYLYVKSMVNSEFKLKKVHLLHFVPVFIQGLLYWYLNFRNYEYRREYWINIHEPFTYRIEFDGTFISLAVYSFLSFLALRSFQRWLPSNFSETSKINLNWLKLLLLLLVILCAQWFAEVVLRDVYQNFYQYSYSPTILGILSLVLAYRSIAQESLRKVSFKQQANQQKTKTIAVIDSNTLNQISRQMADKRAYLNPKLSLREFAEIIGLPSRIVSEHINQGRNQTFLDFVNEFRIAHFKSLLEKPNASDYTLQSLAFDSGFNSKATFNRVFKKHLGVTPSSYQKNKSQNRN